MTENILRIESTPKTPQVIFKPDGELFFQGRSFPEDGVLFFDSLFDWLDQYKLNPATNTVFTIYLEYHNDITSKYLLKIIRDLKVVCESLTVRWIYDIYDKDLLELGQMICSLSESHFEFIEK